MLRINIEPLMKLRQISHPHRFLTGRLGINRVMATKLLNGKAGLFRLEHIEMLCAALQCTPNDIMEWTPDTTHALSAPLAENHPLRTLAPKAWVDKLSVISYSELGKLMESLNADENNDEKENGQRA